MHSPTVTKVSQATRPEGSWRRTSSKTASEIWSQTLSGWPSVTDSDVNTKRLGIQFFLRKEWVIGERITFFQGAGLTGGVHQDAVIDRHIIGDPGAVAEDAILKRDVISDLDIIPENAVAQRTGAADPYVVSDHCVGADHAAGADRGVLSHRASGFKLNAAPGRRPRGRGKSDLALEEIFLGAAILRDIADVAPIAVDQLT